MLGAIIGDVVGSRFEWNNHRSKDFELFTGDCFPTDDSVMTIAIANALIKCNGNYSELYDRTIYEMQSFGDDYPTAGYGGRFYMWLLSPDPRPYNSWGNGSAMRVSPCGDVASTLEEALELSKITAETTHNHPEGIKGAQATAAAIFLARHGADISEIRSYIEDNFYHIDFTLDEIRETYRFNESCQGTVPQALEAFFESTSFEDAIRNAISIGGDSDTLAAITGSVAEAYYGVPDAIRREVYEFLDSIQISVLEMFEGTFMKG